MESKKPEQSHCGCCSEPKLFWGSLSLFDMMSLPTVFFVASGKLVEAFFRGSVFSVFWTACYRPGKLCDQNACVVAVVLCYIIVTRPWLPMKPFAPSQYGTASRSRPGKPGQSPLAYNCPFCIPNSFTEGCENNRTFKGVGIIPKGGGGGGGGWFWYLQGIFAPTCV